VHYDKVNKEREVREERKRRSAEYREGESIKK